LEIELNSNEAQGGANGLNISTVMFSLQMNVAVYSCAEVDPISFFFSARLGKIIEMQRGVAQEEGVQLLGASERTTWPAPQHRDVQRHLHG